MRRWFRVRRKDELARVRDSWCKKKLGLGESDADLDKMIKDICETMKGDARKQRVTFYYLLGRESAARSPTSGN